MKAKDIDRFIKENILYFIQDYDYKIMHHSVTDLEHHDGDIAKPSDKEYFKERTQYWIDSIHDYLGIED